MHIKHGLVALLAAAALGSSALAGVINVAMDQQINVGAPGTAQSPSGNAIYPLSGTGSTLAFGTDGVDGWSSVGMPGGGWYYLYLDLGLAGIGHVDMSQAGSTVSFDARFYQDAQTNTNPYQDAPIFARLYNYTPNGNTLLGYRDYGIVYATQPTWNNPPYPDWTRVSIDVNNAGTAFLAWDPSNVTRIRWYGTDWKGTGRDVVDIKDVAFNDNAVVPEPGSMALLLAGVLPLVARLRRRKA